MRINRFTRPSGSQQFHEEAGSVEKTLATYEGHYQHQPNDTESEKVINVRVGAALAIRQSGPPF